MKWRLVQDQVWKNQLDQEPAKWIPSTFEVPLYRLLPNEITRSYAHWATEQHVDSTTANEKGRMRIVGAN